MLDLWIMSHVLNHCIVPQPLLIDENSSIVVLSGYWGMEYSPLEAAVLGLILVVTQNGFFYLGFHSLWTSGLSRSVLQV